MATTTNYGWTTPDNTDLVKDGAAAIRTLGSAIDTSMNTALGTKKAGMVLLNTTSFTTQSSVSVSNFTTSSYANYYIVMDAKGSASFQWNFRFRENTTDKTASYYGITRYARYTTSSGSLFASNNTGVATINAGGSGQASTTSLTFYKLGTGGVARIVGEGYNAGDGDLINFAYSNDAMTDVTGFTIYPDTGTITGSISVYGFNK